VLEIAVSFKYKTTIVIDPSKAAPMLSQGTAKARNLRFFKD